MSDSIVLRFGNTAPQMQHRQDDGSVASRRAEHLEQSVTRVEFWPGIDDDDLLELTLSTDNDRMLALIARTLAPQHRRYAVAIAELEQIVGVHAGGANPAWVDSDDEGLARAVAAHFPGCSVGEPTALLTNAGRDALHAQHLSTSAQPAAFNYVALTASVVAPAAADTTLTGEIATGGGGLVRGQATYAHTAGTNTTTLTKTFTANGSDALPVTIAQIGVFNAASVGTLGYHTALNSTATLTAAGDSITVTETVTGG